MLIEGYTEQILLHNTKKYDILQIILRSLKKNLTEGVIVITITLCIFSRIIITFNMLSIILKPVLQLKNILDSYHFFVNRIKNHH